MAWVRGKERSPLPSRRSSLQALTAALMSALSMTVKGVDINYDAVLNLSLEAKQKLSQIRPLTIAQASRISGINPADISVLLIYLKQHY